MNCEDKDKFEFYKFLLADRQRMFDIARETNYSLWNALLSFNGIIITVFTGFLALVPTINSSLILLIILTSVISAILIIFNFKSTKNFYFNSAIDYFDESNKIDKMKDIDAQKAHSLDIKKNEKRQALVAFFENISLVLIIIQMFLIMIFIFSK